MHTVSVKRGYRMIKKILDVAVVVPNGKEASKWYSEKLGLKVHADEGHWITVGPGGSQTIIHLCEGEPDPGNTGIGFVADDLDATYRELSSKGVRFTKKPADEGFGKYAMFSDPYGNEYWLMQE
jgi:lactoylglutathione lyase